MNFSTKERTLLEDQKNHEQICIQKYSNYANLASDPQLKNIFKQNGQIEQEHYNTLDQLLKGQMPQMQQSGSQQGGQQQGGTQQQGSNQQQSSGMQMKSQQGGGQQSGSQQQGWSQQQNSSQQQGVAMMVKSQQRGSQQQGGGQQQMSPQQMSQQSSFMPKNQSSGYNNSDKDLCTDMLMTEKYVSGAYNTAIFEFRDPQVRNILNHIQKEEQQHGETIFKYMESNGMYQVK